jgi:hypothetical protein
MTPFELRYAVFSTAKELVENQYKAHMAAWELMDKTTAEAKKLAPKVPTMSEFLEAAVAINKFVSDSNEKQLVSAARKMTGF